MRKLFGGLALLWMACSSSTGPSRFPDVGGTYRLDVTIDPEASHRVGVGFVTLNRTTERTGYLEGTALVYAAVGGTVFTYQILRDASVTESGGVSFNLSGVFGDTWAFIGTATTTGATMTGSHVLTTSRGTFVGRWNAESSPGFTPIRPTTPTPSPRPPTTATPTATQTPVPCCRVCTTGKACGDSCIAENLNCNQPPGCACNGVAGAFPNGTLTTD